MNAMICVVSLLKCIRRVRGTYTSGTKQDGAQHLCKPLTLKVLVVLAHASSQVAASLSHTIWPSTASRTCSRSWSAMLMGYAGCPSRDRCI